MMPRRVPVRKPCLLLLVLFLLMQLYMWHTNTPMSTLRCSEWITDRDLGGVTVPGEEWCWFRGNLGGAIQLVNSGGVGPRCNAFLDVRFADGTLSTGNRLDFSSRPMWTIQIGSLGAVYMMVRKDTANCQHIDQITLSRVDSTETVVKPGTVIEPDPSRLRVVRTLQAPLWPTATITVFTQLDWTRLPRLVRLAESIQLPISAVVLCDNDLENLLLVDQFYNASQVLKQQVTLTVVQMKKTLKMPEANSWPRHRFPVGEMRNAAMNAARTDWVLYVECDMIFGGNRNPDIAAQSLELEVRALTKSSRLASILPVYDLREDFTLLRTLPSKTQLQVRGAHFKDVGLRPCSYQSHRFMSYLSWEEEIRKPSPQLLNTQPQWLSSGEVDSEDLCCHFVNGIPQCSNAQMVEGWTLEPYFVARKHQMPQYDLAIEFGTWDKLEQIKVMMMCGWRFAVNPSVYLYNAPNNNDGLISTLVGTKVKSEEISTKSSQKAQYYQWYHHVSWINALDGRCGHL